MFQFSDHVSLVQVPHCILHVPPNQLHHARVDRVLLLGVEINQLHHARVDRVLLLEGGDFIVFFVRYTCTQDFLVRQKGHSAGHSAESTE